MARFGERGDDDMDVISLSVADLSIAAFLLILLALASFRLQLGLETRMLTGGLRMIIQLLLIGQVLRFLFTDAAPLWIGCMLVVMLSVAAREVRARQRRRLNGITGYWIGMFSMFISSFTVTFMALTVMIQVRPWYTPQYAIPLLGMVLGNTMTGIALASDRLTSQLYDQRNMVEQRLVLGQSWREASSDIRRDCMRTGMVPIINSMAAAGIVSLPGMMTGQILGGTPPVEAVKYQILIMFLIAAGTGFGVICSIWMTSRKLFDSRDRLCLDRLISKK
ncbi:MAG: iron export ABC transporter permease subunit FetB [Desulfocapsaceae bacterium]|nr:iron export ABC transporter permease subunit FetB [Desulfocapsaceae bacterium]